MGMMVLALKVLALFTLYNSLTKTKRLNYKIIKLDLQRKFGYNYKGFVKTEFWKRM